MPRVLLPCFIRPIKRLENVRQVLRGDSDPRVLYRKVQPMPVAGTKQLDRPMGSIVFDGVSQEIDNHAPKPAGGDDVGKMIGESMDDRHLLFLSQGGNAIRAFAQQC